MPSPAPSPYPVRPRHYLHSCSVWGELLTSALSATAWWAYCPCQCFKPPSWLRCPGLSARPCLPRGKRPCTWPRPRVRCTPTPHSSFPPSRSSSPSDWGAWLRCAWRAFFGGRRTRPRPRRPALHATLPSPTPRRAPSDFEPGCEMCGGADCVSGVQLSGAACAVRAFQCTPAACDLQVVLVFRGSDSQGAPMLSYARRPSLFSRFSVGSIGEALRGLLVQA